jgi:hypothetical protein
VSPRRRVVVRGDWDFSKLMAGEERQCATWEYARESPLLRTAWLRHACPPVTPETVFLRDVHRIAPSDYLVRDWITTAARWRERLVKKATNAEARRLLSRETFAFSRPGILSASAATWPGVELLCANWFAPYAEIEADLRRAFAKAQVDMRRHYPKAQIGQAKTPKKYLVMLNALSAWRLHRLGRYTFGEIAQIRHQEGGRGELASLERMAKRDEANVAGFFTALFPGVPLPVRMRKRRARR